ncbi:hypothetical protein TW95_gp1143 [Pandoravirus inopinatum]|uniref:Uncharacterized protein n=1 Tax=Pandoravirus inopinatum TaxID=1605721 RepID=A0A0B5JDR4_9VIRU|nr:hypothetical protein TW95_gp1143 [Pandoravirus inopinatum]AJF97877.1 hypothetical protein [Pandoravirus inopinatum]
MAAGHAHVVAPADVDHAAYALSCPLPAEGLPAEAAATIDAHLEQALVDDERVLDMAAYHTAALVHYAVEIAMAIGWDYKPAVNFAVARYISVAGTPLLAEEGGLLPDEIPRRRRPHRHAEAKTATNRRHHRRDHDAGGDRMCLYDDSDDDSSSVADHGDNLFGANDGDNNNDDSEDEDEIILPAETRDEAVARHRALADRRRRHPPMGMDLELVAAVLQAEAEDGLARTPANLDEMRRRLRAAVGTRLKPSKADRKIDRYAVPWAYGVCCALDRRDVDEVLASPQGAAAVRERAARAWAAETAADGSTAVASTARKPPRPLAPTCPTSNTRNAWDAWSRRCWPPVAGDPVGGARPVAPRRRRLCHLREQPGPGGAAESAHGPLAGAKGHALPAPGRHHGARLRPLAQAARHRLCARLPAAVLVPAPVRGCVAALSGLLFFLHFNISLLPLPSVVPAWPWDHRADPLFEKKRLFYSLMAAHAFLTVEMEKRKPNWRRPFWRGSDQKSLAR